MKGLKLFLYAAVPVCVFLLATWVTIGVTLKDEDTVTCPDITGRDVGDARIILEQKGLSLAVARYEKRKDVQYNQIVLQKPDANMAVRRGRTVSVVVSEGPFPVSIPLVVDHTLTYAEGILRERNIAVKKVIFVPHREAGKVLAQIPRSGENILDEAGMTLIVGSHEKEYFLVPQMLGKNYLAVVAEMERKQIGHRVTCWSHLGNIAYLLRRKLRWDPAAERFQGDDEANRLLQTAYRQPWRL